MLRNDTAADEIYSTGIFYLSTTLVQLSLGVKRCGRRQVVQEWNAISRYVWRDDRINNKEFSLMRITLSRVKGLNGQIFRKFHLGDHLYFNVAKTASSLTLRATGTKDYLSPWNVEEIYRVSHDFVFLLNYKRQRGQRWIAIILISEKQIIFYLT